MVTRRVSKKHQLSQKVKLVVTNLLLLPHGGKNPDENSFGAPVLDMLVLADDERHLSAKKKINAAERCFANRANKGATKSPNMNSPGGLQSTEVACLLPTQQPQV